MAGVNPYIKQPEVSIPRKSFRITFEPMGKTINVVPRESLGACDGLPGSVLQIAHNSDIDLEHTCGGVCACSTCHVIVRSGIDSCNEATDDEEDMFIYIYLFLFLLSFFLGVFIYSHSIIIL